jgi:hypothetical protein
MQVHIDPPPSHKIAPMDMPIAVGFGEAYVTKDGETIFNENDVDDFSKCWRVKDAEEYARKDPNHKYRIVMHAPLHGETYERNDKGEWVLVSTNRGFA